MDDLISRQAAIDALRGYLVGKRCPDDGTLTCRLIENEVINKLPLIQPDKDKVLYMLSKQPTIQPEPHWIPVTERLPEDERNVFIAYYDDITIGWYRKSVNTWIIYEGEGNAEPDEVTAWMPLPEPYKGVTE